MTKDYETLVWIQATNTTIINTKGKIKLPTKIKEIRNWGKNMSNKGSKDIGKWRINLNQNDLLHIISYNPYW